MSTEPLDHENNVTPEQIAELVQTMQACQNVVDVMATRLEHIEKELVDKETLLQQLITAVQNLYAFLNDHAARGVAGHSVFLELLAGDNATAEQKAVLGEKASQLFEVALELQYQLQKEADAVAAGRATAENNA
jgi:uncharacterized protein YaaN involved in tellurite resistance